MTFIKQNPNFFKALLTLALFCVMLIPLVVKAENFSAEEYEPIEVTDEQRAIITSIFWLLVGAIIRWIEKRRLRKMGKLKD